jgi:hypothetical protein
VRRNRARARKGRIRILELKYKIEEDDSFLKLLVRTQAGAARANLLLRTQEGVRAKLPVLDLSSDSPNFASFTVKLI